jgi:hypothetical protein
VIPNLAGLSQDPEEVGVLLPGIPYEVAQRVRFELRQEGFLWVGRTAPGRDIVLTSNGSLLNGMIVSPTGRWAIQPAGAGHLLLLADDTAEPPDIVELPPAVLRHDPPTEPAGAGPIVIDVMILFTRQAAEGAGGGQAMRNLAQYAVDVQNVVMANSGMIDVTFNLVHTRAVRRNDSGNSLADLEWLRTDPEPMYLRDLYGADLVTLAADSLGGVSGRAYLQISPGPGFAPFAVSVVLRPIMGTSFIYQHEVGHSLGMDHSIENATVLPPNGSFPWSYGHLEPVENGNTTGFATVLTYLGLCGGTPPCFKVPYYSNAGLQFAEDPYQGRALGIPDEAENYRTGNAVAPIVAQFRTTALMVFANGFD